MNCTSNNRAPNGELGIIALESCRDLGEKIDVFLQCKSQNINKSNLIKTQEIRFSNGEGKVVIEETVRGKDIFILCDIGNYSCTYDLFGFTNHKGPDEHFQDIKRTVSALCGRARRVTVIMPMLYASRQHRRKMRESLDCALALQELEKLGVNHIITFDVHDPNVQNSIPLVSFQNLYPTYDIVKTFIEKETDLNINSDNMIVISPDTGAMDRSIYYASVLGLDIGLFYKRRDYTQVVNGKNPIVQHEYMGKDVAGLDVFVTDDMISSGESLIDIILELKRRKAGKIYLATTFALFTEGKKKYSELYKQGLVERVYSTNLTHISQDIKDCEWFVEVDMAEFLANIINNINKDQSIAPLLDATENIKKLIVSKNNK